jgi:hypothetical protein
MASSKHVSLPSSFSSGDPTEWFKRFEICCSANDWNDEMQAKKMPTLLEGEALAVYLDLQEDEQKDYKVAKRKITERLAPVQFVSLDDFHCRKRHPGESLSVFLHALKRLLTQAMPDANAATRQQLLCHQFLAGLPTSVSKQLRATGTVNDLDDIVERAKLLLTLEQEERPVATLETSESLSQFATLQQQITNLTEQVAALSVRSGRRTAGASNKRCYRCGQLGHFQRDCKRCFSCGQQGHLAKDCRSGNGRGMHPVGQVHPRKHF